MSSGSVQITVAAIGLVGSIAVAYITTGAAFEAKLRAQSASVAQLRDSLKAVEARMDGIRTQLASAHNDANALQNQVHLINMNPALMHFVATHKP